jgi:hypothetical protein
LRRHFLRAAGTALKAAFRRSSLSALGATHRRLDVLQYVIDVLEPYGYGVDHAYFKIRADDGNFDILRQDTSLPGRPRDLVSFLQTGQGRQEGN